MFCVFFRHYRVQSSTFALVHTVSPIWGLSGRRLGIFPQRCFLTSFTPSPSLRVWHSTSMFFVVRTIITGELFFLVSFLYACVTPYVAIGTRGPCIWLVGLLRTEPSRPSRHSHWQFAKPSQEPVEMIFPAPRVFCRILCNANRTWPKIVCTIWALVIVFCTK